ERGFNGCATENEANLPVGNGRAHRLRKRTQADCLPEGARTKRTHFAKGRRELSAFSERRWVARDGPVLEAPRRFQRVPLSPGRRLTNAGRKRTHFALAMAGGTVPRKGALRRRANPIGWAISISKAYRIKRSCRLNSIVESA